MQHGLDFMLTKAGLLSTYKQNRRYEIMFNKEWFQKKFGQGTVFDLDYGKLAILALCIYIAFIK